MAEENKKEGYFEEAPKTFIPPDYSSASEEHEDAPGFDDELVTEDEGATETELDKVLSDKKEKEKENMTTTPFGTPPTESTPWGSGSSGSAPAWGSTSKPAWGSGGGSTWGSGSSTPWNAQSTPWSGGGNSGSTWGQGQKETLNREKQVIFIDFLDCIVETWSSNGQPGLLPRDIYDLKPRFEVWTKLSAFNPLQVYMIVSRNLLPNTNGGGVAVQATMDYFCCALSAFLRIPYTNCQCLIENRIGQPKEELMGSIIRTLPVTAEKILSIGIYSGTPGMSNRDLVAAQRCQIDHLDLGQLLNMI